MDGFWLIRFTGLEGFSGGVMTLIQGKLFGGDSSHIYSGAFAQQENTVNVQVHVKNSSPEPQRSTAIDEFDVELTGTLQGGAIVARGSLGESYPRFQAKLTKQGELP